MNTLHQALDHAADAIVIHTPDGRLLYANDKARRDVGIEERNTAAIPPWGWTSAPRKVLEKRMREIRERGTHSFVSSVRSPERAGYFEVHSRLVETDDGPVVVSITREVTERIHAEEALKELAFKDPLTGLANRTLLEDRLKLAISSASRHGDPLGVIYLDIDDFKPVNDTHGHDIGDRVLVTLAERMTHSVRAEDTVARVGGDEFVIVLPRLSDRDDIARAAAKIREVISEPIAFDDRCVCSVSATIGYALFDPENDDAHSILIRADLAMYHARQLGEPIAAAPALD